MEIHNFLEFVSSINYFHYLAIVFFIAIMSASINHSILYFLLFVLAFEIIYYCICQAYGHFWDIGRQTGLFCAALLGFLIGRAICNEKDCLKSLDWRKKKN